MTQETTTGEPVEADPRCYRHPDRETHVRCTRCDRPICPDCMTVAAVGFQCPVCVKEGNKSVRQARTMFGGRVGKNEGHVTKVLVGINVVAFVVQLASNTFTADYGLWILRLVIGDEYYRMVTSAFLHDTGMLLHIGFNMAALFIYGTQVERLLGPVRYLALYLLAALGGSVASLYFQPLNSLSIGASGAVFGLFGAVFVAQKKLQTDTTPMIVLLVINIAFGLTFPRVNNAAHFGGLAVGALVMLVYTQVPRGRWQTLLHLGGAAVIAVVLAALTSVRVAELDQRIRRELRLESIAPTSATTSSTGAPSR